MQHDNCQHTIILTPKVGEHFKDLDVTPVRGKFFDDARKVFMGPHTVGYTDKTTLRVIRTSWPRGPGPARPRGP
jgi:hypothetical protein